ncbi:YceH family protein [Shewanella surugensis]|uniref:YceH family protein n=1 Tax=Shewanella surugensis TaxID=212020 RepID=A0ABT0LEP7_9GAMM|nr:YceH family protein [Shewanella surugensis]MCL1126179.1 YceH family protein [Shewanella surugensis]
MELTPLEARIIGVLLEKEITTPEQYPLSLNSLTLGCNQKSSREPVLSLSEQETQAGLNSLAKKRVISEQSGFGSRVVKYKHRFCNTEFSDLQLNSAQVAILCLLFLRGPQTPGELRTRSNRLHAFVDVNEVDNELKSLASQITPLVTILPKEPGKREARFDECFTPVHQSTHQERGQTSGQSHLATTPPRADSHPAEPASHQGNKVDYNQLLERVNLLEQDVDRLKIALADLLD